MRPVWRSGGAWLAVERSTRRFAAAQSTVIAAAAAYMMVVTIIRLEMAGLSTAGLHIAGAAQNAIFDILLILAVAGLLIGLTHLLRPRPKVRRTIEGLFVVIGLLLVVLACVNMQAVTMIGGPLTYQWLYHADFLLSYTSQVAVRSALNARFLLILLLACLSYLALFLLLTRLLRSSSNSSALPIFFISAAAATVGYLIVASHRLPVPEAERVYVANPLIELVASTLQGGTSDFLRQPDAVPPRPLPPPRNDQRLLPAELADGEVKNIILVVMESVGANHVAGTGPPHARNWTPHLARYGDRALAFTNVYSHVPNSTKALFSLFSGRVPLFSISVESYALRDAPLVTLGSRLKGLGYRTALFMSGDLAYNSVDAFLEGRGFDRFSDMTTIGCSGGVYVGSTTEWPNLDSVDDRCTADALVHWLAQPSERPSFGVLWTGNTHWPYFSRPGPRAGEYSQEPTHNRYIGALRASDAAVGGLLKQLERRNMLRNTLVIVVGDHGESFKEHGFSVHGSTLFEEEVRIPLLIIGDSIQGRPIGTLGGISDVAPTILHLIGAKPEPSWDGRSLFDPNRPERVMLFAPNRDFLVGFREGSRKYIYEASRARALVFDLATDPGEMRNIADERSADYTRRHVAGWMKQQERRLSHLQRRD